MLPKRWVKADLTISDHPRGLLLQQDQQQYIARDWVFTEQVQTFVDTCVVAGLVCAIRYRHPAQNIRMTKGINWIGFSRMPAERWVAVIDEFCPKVDRPDKRIERIVINKYYRGIVEKADISYWFQTSNVANIHVAFEDMPDAIKVCADNTEAVETALRTRDWEERKARIGLVTESHLEDYIVQNWSSFNFGRKLAFIGNQVKYMDIVARDTDRRFYIFELKRGPAGKDVYEQLIRYLDNQARSLGGSLSPYGAIIAKTFNAEIRAAACAGTYPVALIAFDDSGDRTTLEVICSTWPSPASL